MEFISGFDKGDSIVAREKIVNDLAMYLKDCSFSKEVFEKKILMALEELSVSRDLEDNTLFFQILNDYDKYISDSNKLNVLLLINDVSIFREYALKYYELFEGEFKKIVFYEVGCCDYDFSDGLFIDCEIDGYIMMNESCLSRNVLECYSLFNHVIKFFIDGKITNWYWKDSLLVCLSYAQLVDLLKREMAVNVNSSLNAEIVRFILCKCNYDWEGLKNDFSSDVVMNNILIKVVLGKLDSFDYPLGVESLIKVCENSLNKFGNRDIGIDQITGNLDLYYLISLNNLRKIPIKERKNSGLYLKCFQVFTNIMFEKILKKNKYDGELVIEDVFSDEELVIIEALFQRIINNGKRIFEILSINDKKTLYHYFKTNELVHDIPLSLEEIKRYNAKQYLKLSRCLKETLDYEMSDLEKIMILRLLETLEYDFLDKNGLLKKATYISSLQYLSYRVSGKDQEYIKKLIILLKEDITVLSDSNNFKLVMDIYECLYKNDFHFEKGERITLNRIKKIMNSCEYILYPNNRHISKNLEKLNFVCKGEPLIEKIEGIKLYNDYRFRLVSSIPDISGRVGIYSYQMVDMHDPDIISNGIGEYVLPQQKFMSSCLTPNGKAAFCLRHGAVNEQGRFF